MQEASIAEIVKTQRKYFLTGATLPLERRKQCLLRLERSIQKHRGEIADALKKDLGKSEFEGYMCEVGLVVSELNFMLKHMEQYAANERVKTPLAQFAARSYIKKSPYGVVLIMSPWNYPFMLSLDPLIDALAAGNTVVLKPSNYSPHTSRVLQKIIKECFPPRLVAVVTGGREENRALLEQKFNYIFFTGSQSVGRVVMEKAARHLTPVTLELGGKSPCIVDATADVRLAARRIVFGKYLNCGQTCVAPDYVLCHRSVKKAFIKAVKGEIIRQFGANPLDNPDYGRIINDKHFRRILGLIDERKVIWGGQFREETCQINPTVMDDVTYGDLVMKEEIFGPLMPIITFDSLREVIRWVQAGEQPLALYLFSSSEKNIAAVTGRLSYGGGCINDVLIHLATSEMAFGGVGESGMGAYHGKAGFDTFSHKKSIVDKKTWIDLPMRYQPYTKWKRTVVELFEK